MRQPVNGVKRKRLRTSREPERQVLLIVYITLRCGGHVTQMLPVQRILEIDLTGRAGAAFEVVCRVTAAHYNYTYT